MSEPSKSRFHFSIQTLLIATLAFALGMVARNIASGLHPFTMKLVLPSSTTPVWPGDSLIIESDKDPGINRRVRVLADGTIALKWVGTIKVSGKNVKHIEDIVKDNYRTHYGDSRYRNIHLYRADAVELMD